MNRIAKFHKVDFTQFLNDWIETFENFDSQSTENIEALKKSWNNITLPKRSTIGSAGYDFVSPVDFDLNPGEEIKIPTGIRCEIDKNWVLLIYPRSSVGFKYKVCLANTAGVIDSDYFYADNDGHIMVKLVNRGDELFSVNRGDKIVQGIFLPYGITVDDDANGERTGGFGSTGR